MTWLPESLNKHRVPSPKEIRANQGLQTHWAALAFQTVLDQREPGWEKFLGAPPGAHVLLGRQRLCFRSISCCIFTFNLLTDPSYPTVQTFLYNYRILPKPIKKN